MDELNRAYVDAACRLRDEQDGGKTLFVTIRYNDGYSYNSTKYEDPYGRR